MMMSSISWEWIMFAVQTAAQMFPFMVFISLIFGPRTEKKILLEFGPSIHFRASPADRMVSSHSRSHSPTGR